MKLVSALFLLVMAFPASAQTVSPGVYDMKDREFTADEVKRALAPQPSANSAGATDGAAVGKARRTRGLNVEAAAPQSPSAQDVPRKLSMQLQFDLNSAEISDGARSRLDALGMALQSPELSSGTYIVSGHTDVSGRYDYNLGLSKRRAEAVKAYLVSRHQVDPTRIIPVGRGPDELLDASDPKSAANRRVQVEAAK